MGRFTGIKEARRDKLFRDKLWRLQHLYWIKDKNRRRVKLRFNPAQQRIINKLLPFWVSGRPVRHFDLKARQVGASTLYSIIELDDTVFHRNTNSGIIAQQRSSLNHIWEIVRFAHAGMSSSIRPSLLQDSARVLSFKGLNSKIFVDLKVLSTNLNNLHISEYPLCNEKVIEQTIAACPPKANITIEGVAEGMNHAYNKYQEMKGQGLTLFHPWFLQPEYRLPTLGFKVKRTAEELELNKLAELEYGITLDDEQIMYRRQAKVDFKELFPALMSEDDRSCFLSSGNPFFSAPKMDALLRELKLHKVDNLAEVGDAWEMWERPVKGHRYAAGADVAEGLDAGGDQLLGGRDYSVLGIICVTCKQQAFRYRARVGVDKFYRDCNQWGLEYGQALLGVELNNHGHAVVMGLRELRYPSLYCEGADETALLRSRRVKKEVTYGWLTNAGNKAAMLEQFRQAIEGKFEDDAVNFVPEITVLDEEFLREAFTFRNKGGKLGSDAGHHDDTIMAWAIAYQMYLRVRANSAVISDPASWKVGDELEASKLFRGKN